MEKKRLNLVKPTLQTPFHIDFQWWRQNDRDWRVYIQSYLSEDTDLEELNLDDDMRIDIIDQETAEVHQVDGLQHLLISQYAQRDDFITDTTSVAEAIFRLLLANGNAPLTPTEMGDKLEKEPKTVLGLLSGSRVYKGIRPLL
jgi:hypothetical protein